MRLVLIITSALLAFLTGLGCWLLLSGERTYGWVKGSALEYVVGTDPMLEDSSLEGPFFDKSAAQRFALSQFGEALDNLSRHVSGNYLAYAVTSSTGRRVTLGGGSSFPLFQELYVSESFFEARGVEAQHGRLWRGADLEGVVIGYALAKRLFGAPRLAVGQQVKLYTPGSAANTERKVIVGVLNPSPAQDPELDADNALVTPLATRLEEEQATPLYLFVRFANAEEAERVTPQMSAWSRVYFGPESVVEPIDSLLTERDTFAVAVLQKLAARRGALAAFVGLLALAMVATLYTQLYGMYLHEQRRLGVELVLGASRKRAALTFAARQFPYGLVGGGIGAFSLWLLQRAPYLSHERLPVNVLSLAALLPSLALLILVVIAVAPLFIRPIASLVQRPSSPRYTHLPLYLTYGGLSLAISGGLASTQVHMQLRAEATALETQFASIYALQTNAAVLDLRLERAFETPRTALPVFGEEDARVLASLSGVSGASLAHAIPQLAVRRQNRDLFLRAAVADGAYLGLVGLELNQGDLSGCVISRRAAGELDVGVGERLELTGAHGSTSCHVSGILEPPPALWEWLVVDLPEIILPVADVDLALSNPAATSFRSSRVLLGLVSEALPEVQRWLASAHPDARAELLPYVPDAQVLLANLRNQAQLFLFTALLAAVLSLAGILNGGLLFLRLGLSRIALDRALGMPARYLLRAWWFQALGVGALSTLAGWLVGYALTARLYNALALGIPGLPTRESVALSPGLALLMVVALFIVSTGFVVVAARWVQRQTSLTPLEK